MLQTATRAAPHASRLLTEIAAHRHAAEEREHEQEDDDESGDDHRKRKKLKNLKDRHEKSGMISTDSAFSEKLSSSVPVGSEIDSIAGFFSSAFGGGESSFFFVSASSFGAFLVGVSPTVVSLSLLFDVLAVVDVSLSDSPSGDMIVLSLSSSLRCTR